MVPVAIAPVIEHIGDVYAINEVAGKDFVKDPGLHRTMLGDGVASTVASFIGGPPVTKSGTGGWSCVNEDEQDCGSGQQPLQGPVWKRQRVVGDEVRGNAWSYVHRAVGL